jgi:hypothetical protein
MEDLHHIVDRLAEFARRHDLIARAKDGCSKFLRNIAGENDLPRGWSLTDVRQEFRAHTLTFESNVLSYPFVVTQLDLYAGEDEIGWYKLVVRLDGQAEDDYLVFHPDLE